MGEMREIEETEANRKTRDDGTFWESRKRNCFAACTLLYLRQTITYMSYFADHLAWQQRVNQEFKANCQ